MTTLYVTVGLPGCGKSTWAKTRPECKVVSTDAIRARLFADEEYQDNNALVFQTAHEEATRLLDEGYDVIFDACSITKWAREDLLHLNTQRPYQAVAIVFSISVDECIRRQSLRDRKVPASVIRKFAEQMVIPTKEEGFSSVTRAFQVF